MAIKQKRKWYIARVSDAGRQTVLICEVYNPHGGSIRGAEFHLVATNNNISAYVIPSSRQATFLEELFVTETAAGVLQAGADLAALEQFLRDQFGGSHQVDVQNV